MSWQDAINGSYEFIGGIFLLLNCFKLYKDKEVKGVSIFVSGFFATWSWWNCYYYPHLNQWLSFAGGLLIGTTNAAWVIMATYYMRKEIALWWMKNRFYVSAVTNVGRLVTMLTKMFLFVRNVSRKLGMNRPILPKNIER